MKKQKAFTLAEVLIALGIIGVLMGAAMHTLKPFDKNIKYIYSSTYYSIEKAFYNAITYWIPLKDDRNPFASGLTDETASIRLCKALIEYINIVEPTECSKSGTTCSNDSLACQTGRTVDDLGKSTGDTGLKDTNVQFTSTNGVRYWISGLYPTGATADDKKFFIIYADINGTKYPNSMDYAVSNGYTTDPDIFAFAALETGRICPLGPPEVDMRYLTTRIVYEDSVDAEGVTLKYSSPSRPYAYSKAEAWGYYATTPPTGIASSEMKDDEYMDEAPFSYNDYIRSKISPDSKIYSFIGKDKSGNNISIATYAQNRYNDTNEFSWKVNENKPNATPKGYGCVYRSQEHCDVNIDKYVF